VGIIAGIEIGGTKVQILVENENGKIVDRFRNKVNAEQGAEAIQKDLEKKLSIIQQSYGIHAIGIGFGGPIDRSTGRIYDSFHVRGWSGFNVKDWLKAKTRTEIFVENDANVAALAEAKLGAGLAYQKVFYITLGSGTGSGFVVDGKLYHGSSGCEMEFGHIRINETSTIEEKCSGWSIDKQIRNSITENPGSLLAALVANDPGNEARHLKIAIENGDELARRIFSESMKTLAFGLSHVVHLLSPDVIVVGGGLSLMGEILCIEIEKYLPRYLMNVLRPGPPIKLAELKEDAVPRGAIEWAKYNLKVTA
jgi:glucokinase